MPDELPDAPPGWEKTLKALKEVIYAAGITFGAIFGGINQCQGKKNGDDIQVVTQKQDVAIAEAVEVKKDLHVVTERTAAKLEAVKAATEVVAEKTTSIDRKIKEK